MRSIRKIYIVAFILSLMVGTSCVEKLFPIVDCNECLDYEPTFATVTMKVSQLGSYPVTINIYEGGDTSGELIYTLNTTFEKPVFEVSLNRTYTFEAIYIDGDKTFRAINAINPLVKYTDSECDTECWYIYNNTVDLRLKYH